jgi:hypothetical protein
MNEHSVIACQSVGSKGPKFRENASLLPVSLRLGPFDLNDDNERRARIASNIQKAKDALDRAIVLRRASGVDE